jgi:hypothetical protein
LDIFQLDIPFLNLFERNFIGRKRLTVDERNGWMNTDYIKHSFSALGGVKCYTCIRKPIFNSVGLILE